MFCGNTEAGGNALMFAMTRMRRVLKGRTFTDPVALKRDLSKVYAAQGHHGNPGCARPSRERAGRRDNAIWLLYAKKTDHDV